MPKISIIIPTYNGGIFIKRTIESVLNQTFTDWELLIVDDCSTDNTTNIVKEFIEKDNRIKLFKTEKNSGCPATPKNIGIENAQGEYVAFLDHDDEWLPEKLEKQLFIFNKSNKSKLGIVSSYITIKDNQTGRILSRHRSFPKKNPLQKLVQHNFFITCSSMIIKKSVFNKVGVFDNKFKVSDDWDMWLRMTKADYEFEVVPEYLVNYFTHENNLSNNNNIEKQLEEFKILIAKNCDSLPHIKESWFLGYYYFIKGEYNLSRKYYIQNLFSRELGWFMRFKSLAYVILSFCPKLKNKLKKLWWKLK